MARDVLTLPSERLMSVSHGAAATAMSVTRNAPVAVTVIRRLTNPRPPSSSSLDARESSGMNMPVSTEPRTSSVTMFGNWFAVLNAEATAPPRVHRMRLIRTKPVMRETRLAIAIEPVARSRLCELPRAASSAL